MLHVDLSGMHIKQALQFLQYSQHQNLLTVPRTCLSALREPTCRGPASAHATAVAEPKVQQRWRASARSAAVMAVMPTAEAPRRRPRRDAAEAQRPSARR